MQVMQVTNKRCAWCGDDPLYVQYHDEEWGLPQHDDKVLFEFLLLESFQAGLSWITILRKRENFRKAFAGFDPQKVARFTPARVEKLLQDAGIIRNRQKIEASLANARAFLKVQQEFGSFDAYSWGFIGGKPVANKWKSMEEIPVYTDLALAFSKDLKARGFKFVGPTIVYSHMQATGMVNDHVISCFRHRQVSGKV